VEEEEEEEELRTKVEVESRKTPCASNSLWETLLRPGVKLL
jgi:hypothetical protein